MHFALKRHLLCASLYRKQLAVRFDAWLWPTAALPTDVQALLGAKAKSVMPGDIGSVMAMVALALGMRGRDQREMADGTTVQTARVLLQTFAGCMGFLGRDGSYVAPQDGESLAAHVLRASGARETPEALHAIDAALVILAHHELAPASRVARVAASIDAGLCNCVAAAISARVGYSTGAVTECVDTQLFDLRTETALQGKFDMVRTYGASLFGFNHPLYPHGDPRADLLLSLAQAGGKSREPLRAMLRFLDSVKDRAGMTPGLAIALVVLTRAFGLPRGSATALWVIARTAGWVAHVVEQRMQAFMLRPRAKYISGMKGQD
jgi:citrate synthase